MTAAGTAERVNTQGNKDIVSGNHVHMSTSTHQELRNDPQVTMMRNFFIPKSAPTILSPPPVPAQLAQPDLVNKPFSIFELVDYPSDEEYEEYEDSEDEPGGDADMEDVVTISEATQMPMLLESAQTKQRKLEIPVRVQRAQKREEHQKELQVGLDGIRAVLHSKKADFASGVTGLQSYRVRAVQSHLLMLVKNGRHSIEASERAAESQGFAPKWGGRNVRRWTSDWIKFRKLPTSKRGCHSKVYSLLNDPQIKAELRTYVQSNKWAVDPAKLVDFTKGTLLPDLAKKYAEDVLNNEMPKGLKRYMELELFPQIHMKVGRGISLHSARRWLHKEGFKFISHKKGLYFDGHDRPDVVKYRQEVFLKTMEMHSPWIIQYKVGSVENEDTSRHPSNFVERRIVLCAHDEMTAQANDSQVKSWVFEDQHSLWKKGAGRGIHQSGVICSTVGWLKSASQSLEYGKNYDGYWTGELFVKQVSSFSMQLQVRLTELSENSCARRLSQPSRMNTDLVIKH